MRILLAVVMGLAAPAALTAQAGEVAEPAPGRDWHAGLGAAAVRLVSPFGDPCLHRRVRETLLGLEGRIALPVGERSDASLRLTGLLNPNRLEVVCPTVPLQYDVPWYPGEVTGGWAQTIEFRFSTAPADAPFLRAGLGGGWMRGVPTPFGTLSVGLRTEGRLRVSLDAGLRVASALRVRMDPLMEDGLVVGAVERGRDREWAAGADVRLAVDAPLSTWRGSR